MLPSWKEDSEGLFYGWPTTTHGWIFRDPCRSIGWRRSLRGCAKNACRQEAADRAADQAADRVDGVAVEAKTLKGVEDLPAADPRGAMTRDATEGEAAVTSERMSTALRKRTK